MPDGRDIVYLYDGSFDGLLTAIFESYYRRETPVEIAEAGQMAQQALLWEDTAIQTDLKKAERVAAGVRKKIGGEALENLYYAYLSDEPGRGRLCLDYVRTGFRLGAKMDAYLMLDCVARVLDAGRRVRGQAHQYMGFVRFAELEGGIYYSEIEPKCQVLPLLAPHFQARLPQMPWMIHDVGRRQCMVYNGRELYLTPTDGVPAVRYTAEEQQYRKLWREFYRTVEIRQRHNERCRMNHMPKRFWRFLPEMEA